MNERRPPAVFIHDLWLHASSWAPWIDLFETRDYLASAPGWPGDADSVGDARVLPAAPTAIALDDVTRHYGRLIAEHRDRPVLIGHGVGGAVAAELLALDFARAAITIAGSHEEIEATLMPPSPDAAVTLTAEEFDRRFGGAIGTAESKQLFDQWAIPAPGRAVAGAVARSALPQSSMVHPGRPLLRIPAGRTRSDGDGGQRIPGEDVRPFPDRGRSLTIDSGWRDVAEVCLRWLDKHVL